MLLVMLGVACVDPVEGLEDSVDPADSADPADSDTSTPSWAPIQWTDCEGVLDVGSVPGVDDRMVFRPTGLDDTVYFSMEGPVGSPDAMGKATRVDATTWTDVEVFADPPELQVLGFSSPFALRTDAGDSLFFDAREEGDLTGIWRCELVEGQLSDCAVVLPQESHGEFDARSAQIPAVYVDADDTWRLWYTGLSEADERRILTSTSEDGWSWTTPKLAIDLGAEGTWDATSAYSPFVWKDATGWRMIYAGRSFLGEYQVKRLIEARSDDGIQWEGHTMTLDLGCQGSWDSWRVDSPWVVDDGDGLRLYYDGFDDPLTAIGSRRILTATPQ